MLGLGGYDVQRLEVEILYATTVKPVLRGHIWNKDKVLF
jgi:hypothetical protein